MLWGCAGSLERFDLRPREVSPQQFEAYDCEQLADRVEALEVRKDSLLKFFRSHVGRLLGGLFGPFMSPLLLTLEGKDGPKAEEYRQLQGEYIALARVNETQGCMIEFRQPLG